MSFSIRMICLGLSLITVTGCESTNWNWLKRDTTARDTGKLGTAVTAKALVDYLNDNAARVQSVRYDDVAIDASLENQPFGARGRIYADKPKNFRMKVTALGKDKVDIGSNVQEFWFWAADNPQRYQYFCSYQDLARGPIEMMPLPIQPEFVMETLGLGPYSAEKVQLEPGNPTDPNYRLVEKLRSPQGRMVRKVIVMSRKEVRAPAPQVSAYLLLDDATGAEICSAHITETRLARIDSTRSAIVPYRMELRVPAQKMTLKLKLDGLKINDSIPATAFQRQPIMGAEPFNLATGRPEPWSLQPAGLR
ncbi:MAG: hypothetical protein FJ303_18255 [Planctomycetes bacterium]|nr:hypothetical protein [Planctomycetota bacterium]